jgi:hypothetical protein
MRFYTANGCVHPIRHAAGYRDSKARGHCPRCAGCDDDHVTHELTEADAAHLPPAALADRLGYAGPETGTPTEEELKTAGQVLPAIRREVMVAGEAVHREHREWLDNIDAGPGVLQRPPPLEHRSSRTSASGRSEYVSTGAQDWDWFYALSSAEQKRLRSGWFAAAGDSNASGVDELAERVANASGARTQREAIETWLRETRIVDAARSLGVGRLTGSDRYGGLDQADLIESPYNIRRILQGESTGQERVREVAEATRRELADYARRELVSRSRPEGPAPWEMTEAAYVAETSKIEDQARAIDQGAGDGYDEWGPTHTHAEERTLRRYRELIPPGLDDPDQPAALDVLYRSILKTARAGGLV